MRLTGQVNQAFDHVKPSSLSHLKLAQSCSCSPSSLSDAPGAKSASVTAIRSSPPNCSPNRSLKHSQSLGKTDLSEEAGSEVSKEARGGQALTKFNGHEE